MTVPVSITFSVPSQLNNIRFQVGKYKFNTMLFYFKYMQGIKQEIDVKREETMNEFVERVGRLSSMEKVRINIIQHCVLAMTDILLEDTSKDISAHIDFQHKLIDCNNINSTSEIKAMYEEVRYKQLCRALKKVISILTTET